MEDIILENIVYEPNLDQLREELHIRSGTEPNDELEKLAAEARNIAKPKVLYKLAFVDSEDDAAVVVDGVTFKSRVLRVNLDSQHRIFPYAATCGTELDAWARDAGLVLNASIGMHYNPLTREYSLGPGLDVNYLMHFRRPADE